MFKTSISIADYVNLTNSQQPGPTKTLSQEIKDEGKITNERLTTILLEKVKNLEIVKNVTWQTEKYYRQEKEVFTIEFTNGVVKKFYCRIDVY